MADLRDLRAAFWACLGAYADVLFRMCEALISIDQRLPSLAWLSLDERFDRSHDMLYRGLREGGIDRKALRKALLAQPIPRIRGRIVLAVDGCAWPRPEAETADRRTFYFGRGNGKAVPAWRFSFVVALTAGASSWVTPLDFELIGPDSSEPEAAVVQLKRVVRALVEVGHWREGDPLILICTDAGYPGPWLAHQLAGLPVEVVVRCRSNQMWYRDPASSDTHRT